MPSSPESALKAGNLTKQYNGSAKPALDGLDLEIGQGEIFGLLGPNGAGKTTAVSILSTILNPTSGSVTICGLDGLREPMRARRLIGLVPQDIALYDRMTAWENLAFFGKLQGLRGRTLKNNIQAALRAVGLDDKAHQKVGTYSGGMKRRTNLAVGLVHAPRVLFLDEPTVGIDAQSRQLIIEKLREISRNGTAILYTTHYMEEAQQLCHRVAIMDSGRILSTGTPQEIIGRYPECNNLGDLFLHLTGKELRD